MSEEITEIRIKPHGEKEDYAIVEIGRVSVVCNYASVDENDRVILFKDGISIACVDTKGVALEIPNLLRNVIIFGGSRIWKYKDKKKIVLARYRKV